MAQVKAHITGTVWKIEVKVGDTVSEGQTVVVLESMKMEMPVESTGAGTVSAVLIKEGDAVEEGAPLIVIERSQGSNNADAQPHKVTYGGKHWEAAGKELQLARGLIAFSQCAADVEKDTFDWHAADPPEVHRLYSLCRDTGPGQCARPRAA